MELEHRSSFNRSLLLTWVAFGLGSWVVTIQGAFWLVDLFRWVAN